MSQCGFIPARVIRCTLRVLLVWRRSRAEFQEFCSGLAEAHGYSVVYQGLGQAAEAATAFADASTSFSGKDLGYSTQVGWISATVLISPLICLAILCLFIIGYQQQSIKP